MTNMSRDQMNPDPETFHCIWVFKTSMEKMPVLNVSHFPCYLRKLGEQRAFVSFFLLTRLSLPGSALHPAAVRLPPGSSRPTLRSDQDYLLTSLKGH